MKRQEAQASNRRLTLEDLVGCAFLLWSFVFGFAKAYIIKCTSGGLLGSRIAAHQHALLQGQVSILLLFCEIRAQFTHNVVLSGTHWHTIEDGACAASSRNTRSFVWIRLLGRIIAMTER